MFLLGETRMKKTYNSKYKFTLYPKEDKWERQLLKI